MSDQVRNTALTAAKGRCRCDSVGPEMCPAGCGEQRDRMAKAELRRVRESSTDNQTNTPMSDEGEQLQMNVTAAHRHGPSPQTLEATSRESRIRALERAVDTIEFWTAEIKAMEAERRKLADYFKETA